MRLGFLLPVLAAGLAAGVSSATPRADPVRRQEAVPAADAAIPIPCANIPQPSIPDTTIFFFSAEERRNVFIPTPFGATTDPFTVDICDINISLTHNSTKDHVRIQVWLPLEGWNGRFLGTGGGGYIPGTFYAALGPAVRDGFAAASTDAGTSLTFDGSSFFADPDTGIIPTEGSLTLDRQQFMNFAYLSIHDMAVAGKAVTTSYYGIPPNFTYWEGCSTGGRQGMQEAQMYPDDFDGILAVAPAINWSRFVLGGLWSYVVMTEEGEYPPSCVFTKFAQAAIEACDAEDGLVDGVVSNPGTCKFDPRTVIGSEVFCAWGDAPITITEHHAEIFAKVIEGPSTPDGSFLWYPPLVGTSWTTLGGEDPFGLSAIWLGKFMSGMSSYPFKELTYEKLASFVNKSVNTLGRMIDTDNPDLSRFKATGGKILTWHGLDDGVIPPNGTFSYRDRVVTALGGREEDVNDFYRVFQAPGVSHCSGGPGPAPMDALGALIKWVEEGQAPDRLRAAKTDEKNVTVERDLCLYPSTLYYTGLGDKEKPESWVCLRHAPNPIPLPRSPGSPGSPGWSSVNIILVSVFVGLLFIGVVVAIVM